MVRRDLIAIARHAALAAVAVLPVAVLPAARGWAQSPLPGGLPPPPGMSMPAYARHRFPQPVVVGTLIGEIVQRPVESHIRLGHVRAVVREPDGTLAVVMRFDGHLGFGGRDIAVPLDAMALLGRVMEVVGFSPQVLAQFPTYEAGGATVLPRDAVVQVGLAKPSH